ncbi:redoxin domain-containing protein, partial [Pseudoalteromonas sp. SK20]|uniref:redoxin domain-containing protein n=1 Tax=Pseudoalteromonas sp. SK20 TaxID=1938367 RepID=UPI0020C95DD0
ADGGIGKVQYALVADVKHEICKAYDVEHPEAGVAFRGSFLIDFDGNLDFDSNTSRTVDSQVLVDLQTSYRITESAKVSLGVN